MNTYHACPFGTRLPHSGWYSHDPHPFACKIHDVFGFYSGIVFHCVAIHSTVEGHLGCFQFLAIMNKATMRIVEQVSLWILLGIFSGVVQLDFEVDQFSSSRGTTTLWQDAVASTISGWGCPDSTSSSAWAVICFIDLTHRHFFTKLHLLHSMA